MAGKFKPDDQEEDDGKAECYWCDKKFPVEEMKKERQHNTVVYVCKGC